MREILIPLWVLADQQVIEDVGHRSLQRWGLATAAAFLAGLGVMLIAILWAEDIQAQARGQDAVLVIPLVAGLVCLGAAAWVLAHWRRSVAIAQGASRCRVDAEGFEEGVPGNVLQLRWRDVARTPSPMDDVRCEFQAGDSLQRDLVIPTRNGVGVRVPMAMGRECSYLRRFALRRALLLRLATAVHPPLRFDADVFIQAGIDPDTWERDARARTQEWVALAVLVALVLGSTVYGTNVLFPRFGGGAAVAFVVLVVLTAAIASAVWQARRHPRLTGVLSFRVGDA